MRPAHKVSVLAATQPVDFRKGHDGLAALVQSVLKENPFTGTVFVFRAKRADRLKTLFWDGTGIVMACKRLKETTLTSPDIRDRVMTVNPAPWILHQKGDELSAQKLLAELAGPVVASAMQLKDSL